MPSLLARYTHALVSPIRVAPSAFGRTKRATKTTKQATTRDYDYRNIPDLHLFDVVYDTDSHDGFSLKVCHHCLLNIGMRPYLQESRSLLKRSILRAVWHTHSKGIVVDPWDSSEGLYDREVL